MWSWENYLKILFFKIDITIYVLIWGHRGWDQIIDYMYTLSSSYNLKLTRFCVYNLVKIFFLRDIYVYPFDGNSSKLDQAEEICLIELLQYPQIYKFTVCQV